MTDARAIETTDRLYRELIAATLHAPWKTVGLVRIERRREVKFVWRHDLGRALADPEFLGFCSMTTTKEQLMKMVLEGGL